MSAALSLLQARAGSWGVVHGAVMVCPQLNYGDIEQDMDEKSH